MMKRILVAVIVSILLSQVAYSGSITGTVLGLEGLPVEGVWMQLFGYSDEFITGVQTDAGGNYTFNSLQSGFYRICAQPAGTDYIIQQYDHQNGWTNPTHIFVGAVADVTGINFDLEIGASITGTITSPAGTPVLNATAISYGHSGPSYHSRTDPNGVYTITGVIPNQICTIVAYAPEGTDYMLTYIERYIGTDNTSGVDIQFKSGGLTISGTVTDKTTGMPLNDVPVSYHINEYHFGDDSVNTDVNGYYEFYGLPPAEIQVRTRSHIYVNTSSRRSNRQSYTGFRASHAIKSFRGRH